jgi:hypothetical protein
VRELFPGENRLRQQRHLSRASGAAMFCNGAALGMVPPLFTNPAFAHPLPRALFLSLCFASLFLRIYVMVERKKIKGQDDL